MDPVEVASNLGRGRRPERLAGHRRKDGVEFSRSDWSDPAIVHPDVVSSNLVTSIDLATSSIAGSVWLVWLRVGSLPSSSTPPRQRHHRRRHPQRCEGVDERFEDGDPRIGRVVIGPGRCGLLRHRLSLALRRRVRERRLERRICRALDRRFAVNAAHPGDGRLSWVRWGGGGGGCDLRRVVTSDSRHPFSDRRHREVPRRNLWSRGCG